MLILSHKKDQRVVLARDGQVLGTVMVTRGEGVKLGFDLPREIEVHRDDVWESIQREREGVWGER